MLILMVSFNDNDVVLWLLYDFSFLSFFIPLLIKFSSKIYIHLKNNLKTQ